MTVGFRQQRLSNRSRSNELLRPYELGIKTPIICHAQEASAGVCLRHHDPSFRIVDGHGLFAKHMLAGAKCSNGCARMHRHRQRDVHSIHRAILQRFFERRPGLGHRIVAGFRFVPRH